MDLRHHYAVSVEWTGDRGTGTSARRAFGRDHVIRAEGKQHVIAGSADRAFFGDRDRWNPEELLLAALSQCHMLSYLREATTRGIVVVAYRDDAEGTLERAADDTGRFTEAVLHPVVTIASDDEQAALDAHEAAAAVCFISASVAFPVRVEPRIVRATAEAASV